MSVKDLRGFPFATYGDYRAAFTGRSVRIGVDAKLGMLFVLSGKCGIFRKFAAYLAMATPFLIAICFSVYAIWANPWLLLGLLLFVIAHVATHPAAPLIVSSLRPIIRIAGILILLASLIALVDGQHLGGFLLGTLTIAIGLSNSASVSIMLRGIRSRTLVDEEFLCLMWNQHGVNLEFEDGRWFSYWKYLHQGQDNEAPPGDRPPAQPTNPAENKGANVKEAGVQRLHGVLRTPEGKAEILLTGKFGPIEVIRSMTLAARPHLLPQYAAIAERWVGEATGIKVRDGQWTPQHEDAYVRAYERFCWEGGAEETSGSASSTLQSLLRETYPTIAGSPIDVPLNDEMRKMFGSWFAKENQTETAPYNPVSNAKELSTGTRSVSTQASRACRTGEEGRGGTPSEMMERGRFHRYTNFRSLADWEKKMVSEFGPSSIPILKSIWDSSSPVDERQG